MYDRWTCTVALVAKRVCDYCAFTSLSLSLAPSSHKNDNEPSKGGGGRTEKA